MIIRATSKLLSIARIKPVKMEATINGPLPGEWYASLLSYLKYLFGGKIAKAESKNYIYPIDQLKKLLTDYE